MPASCWKIKAEEALSSEIFLMRSKVNYLKKKFFKIYKEYCITFWGENALACQLYTTALET
jgi:hypothetical protein